MSIHNIVILRMCNGKDEYIFLEFSEIDTLRFVFAGKAYFSKVQFLIIILVCTKTAKQRRNY